MTADALDPGLRVHRDGAVWRWVYRVPATDEQPELVLPASIPFVSATEAAEAARTAYPGVPLVVAGVENDSERASAELTTPDRGRGRRWRRLLLAAAAAAVAAAVLRGRTAAPSHLNGVRREAA